MRKGLEIICKKQKRGESSMTDQEKQKLLRDTIEHFGFEHQLRKLAEEMGELKSEIEKYISGDLTAIAGITEESVDVQIVLSQIFLELESYKIAYWENLKLMRLQDLIHS